VKHHLIPARDAAIAADLGRGVSIADLARRWGLGQEYVRQIARNQGVRLDQQRTAVDPIRSYRPSDAAREVLAAVGIDPDTIPGRHLVCQTRDAEMMELLIVDALTLDEVGQKYGLTRERVRQLQVRYLGVSAKTFHARRAALTQAERDQRIAAYAAEHPTASGRQIADAVKVSFGEVRDVIGPDQVALREPASRRSVASVDDDGVFAEIRRIAAKPGGTPLRSTFFDAHRAPGMIGADRVIQRFGTWREACEAAGVEPMPSVRKTYTRRWCDDDLRTVLDRYVVEAWGTWSYARFEEWLRTQDGAPSAQTVRNQLGGKWQDLLQQAIARVNASRESDTAAALG
jgi:hypothetical protein